MAEQTLDEFMEGLGEEFADRAWRPPGTVLLNAGERLRIEEAIRGALDRQSSLPIAQKAEEVNH